VICSYANLAGHCVVGDLTFIGMNAVVRETTTIGSETIVSMGSAVFSDIASGVIARQTLLAPFAKIMKRKYSAKSWQTHILIHYAARKGSEQFNTLSTLLWRKRCQTWKPITVFSLKHSKSLWIPVLGFCRSYDDDCNKKAGEYYSPAFSIHSHSRDMLFRLFSR
jgi:hypothetical protein